MEIAYINNNINIINIELNACNILYIYNTIIIYMNKDSSCSNSSNSSNNSRNAAAAAYNSEYDDSDDVREGDGENECGRGSFECSKRGEVNNSAIDKTEK